jgi:hypothetical protein
MANARHVFYMKVTASDEDTGMEVVIEQNVHAICTWYLRRWASYENTIFIGRPPKIKHVRKNLFQISYELPNQDLEKATINSYILADPDDEVRYPILIRGEFYRVHGVPVNIHTNQDL